MNNTQYTKYLFDKVRDISNANPGVIRDTYGNGENLTHKFLIKELKKFDGYLTDALIEEISNFYPKKDDFTFDPLTNDIIMAKDKFSHNFGKVFPVGRIFLNYIQLREAISIFFKHWNLLSKSNGKNIRCSFSHTTATKNKLSDNNVSANKSNRQ